MSERDLDALLAAAAAADAELETPARIEAGLLAAFRDRHRQPAAPRGPGLRAAGDWLWAGLAAAAAVVAIAAAVRHGSLTAPAPVVAEASEEAEFLPLAGAGAGFDDVEAMQVVAVEMPRTSLAGIGYAGPLVAGEGEALRAELLVGNDGIARGIRFVE